jgi:hypothetical protein
MAQKAATRAIMAIVAFMQARAAALLAISTEICEICTRVK